MITVRISSLLGCLAALLVLGLLGDFAGGGVTRARPAGEQSFRME